MQKEWTMLGIETPSRAHSISSAARRGFTRSQAQPVDGREESFFSLLHPAKLPPFLLRLRFDFYESKLEAILRLFICLDAWNASQRARKQEEKKKNFPHLLADDISFLFFFLSLGSPFLSLSLSLARSFFLVSAAAKESERER